MMSGVMREVAELCECDYPQSFHDSMVIPWEIPDAWQGILGFGIFPTVFLSCFSQPDFPCYVPSPQFWSGHASSVTLHVRNWYNLVLIFRGAHRCVQTLSWVSDKMWTLNFWTLLRLLKTIDIFKVRLNTLFIMGWQNVWLEYEMYAHWAQISEHFFPSWWFDTDLIGNSMGFWNLETQSWCHTFSNKATHPNPSQTVLPPESQAFKHMNLWGEGHLQ